VDVRRSELSLLGLAMASLLASLVFGGASARDGYVSTLVAQLACLPVLGLALWRTARRPRPSEHRAPLMVMTAGLLLPLLYLIPLPPGVWTALPGRAVAAEAYAAAGMSAPWLPLSLDPQATLRSAVALAPGAALFLATLHLGWTSRRRLVWAVLLAGAANAALGFLQVAAGGAFRPYTDTTAGAVGFFANRNHSVALLLTMLPLAGAAAAQAAALRWRGPMLAASGGVALLAVAGLVSGGSRAGVLLLPLAAAAAVGAAASGWARDGRRVALQAGGAGAVLLAVLAALAFVGGAGGERTLRDPERSQLARVTLQAADDFAPLGAGFGAFSPVYQAYENPDTLQDEFANHAHNDWLELWLEGGWPFAAVALAFLAWFARACLRLGRGPPGEAWALQAAGAVVVLLLLIHSSVDYPLRTSALMAVFGLGCGLLVRPGGQEGAASAGGPGRVRPRSTLSRTQSSAMGERGGHASASSRRNTVGTESWNTRTPGAPPERDGMLLA
jgi:hypothetical protein